MQLVEWRSITRAPGFAVSSWGHVRRGAALVGTWGSANDYIQVSLQRADGSRELVSVHTLVLEAFVCPRPPRHQADHLDGDRANNMLSNLEWVTPEENVRRARARNRAARERQFGQANLLDVPA